jgi:hypothetical protein
MSSIELSEFLRHPATLVTGAFSIGAAISQSGVLGVAGAYFWGHLGELFTVMSLAGFTIAPNVAFIPEDALTVLAVIVGALFLVKMLYELGRGLHAQLNNET